MDVFINKVQAVKLFQSSNAAEKSFIFYPVIYILLLVGLLLRICVLQSYIGRNHLYLNLIVVSSTYDKNRYKLNLKISL